jgi:hypothetical protein
VACLRPSDLFPNSTPVSNFFLRNDNYREVSRFPSETVILLSQLGKPRGLDGNPENGIILDFVEVRWEPVGPGGRLCFHVEGWYRGELVFGGVCCRDHYRFILFLPVPVASMHPAQNMRLVQKERVWDAIVKKDCHARSLSSVGIRAWDLAARNAFCAHSFWYGYLTLLTSVLKGEFIVRPDSAFKATIR